jgi:hypothetical protein
MVLYLINSQELFEMAAIDFTAGNWSDAPCFRALCQRFLASFEEFHTRLEFLLTDRLLLPRGSHKWDFWGDPKEKNERKKSGDRGG